MAKAKTGKDVVNWKEQMAAEAKTAVGMEKGVGASNFFSLKGGKLTFNDQQLPNNEMAVIVVDYILENTFYDVDYDPDSPASPVCFAFGRDEETMGPHEDSTDPQNPKCFDCQWNRFGSADRGRGKACRNSRRVALTPAGKITNQGDMEKFEDPDYFENSDVAFLKIPPTSLKSWAQYVREVAGLYELPPAGVYTHLEVVDDDKDQFHVNFKHNGKVADDVMGVIFRRQQALREMESLEQPYQPIEEEEEPAARRKAPAKKKKAKAKTKAKAKSKRRY